MSDRTFNATCSRLQRQVLVSSTRALVMQMWNRKPAAAASACLLQERARDTDVEQEAGGSSKCLSSPGARSGYGCGALLYCRSPYPKI